jgi:hypothetical protein
MTRSTGAASRNIRGSDGRSEHYRTCEHSGMLGPVQAVFRYYKLPNANAFLGCFFGMFFLDF